MSATQSNGEGASPRLRSARTLTGRKYDSAAPPPRAREMPAIGRRTNTLYDPVTGRKIKR